MSEEPLTFNQAVAGISEFIEVAIHTILYVRQVYPPDLFIRRKKYDTPVFQSRHPALNEYISGAVKAVGEEMAQGTVEKVVVIVKNKEQVALERFIFSIDNMIEVESFNKGTNVANFDPAFQRLRIRRRWRRTRSDSGCWPAFQTAFRQAPLDGVRTRSNAVTKFATKVEGAMSAGSLTQYFRSFLIKLCMIEAQLGQMNLGDEVSFAILLELRDTAAPSVSQSKACQ
ncbi:DNA-binding protein [Coprinellus micaceus]|uniref:DNA-binding protein n=1 Tax=Coprinellus micaceus TaxID=71717 RepID=A0A4Y7TXL1_COPMI|nr:DNA-binding protein [Coprinellus micaceus]